MISTLLLAVAVSAGVELRGPTVEHVLKLSDKKTHTVLLEIVNNTDNWVKVWTTTFFINHRIVLRDAQGRDAALTDKGVIAVGLPEWGGRDNNVPIMVRPGGTLNDPTPRLPDYYILRPGKYTLTVTYDEHDMEPPLQLISNRITIKVVE